MRFSFTATRQHQRHLMIPIVLVLLLCVQASSGFLLRHELQQQHRVSIPPVLHNNKAVSPSFRGYRPSRQQVLHYLPKQQSNSLHQKQQETPRLTKTSTVMQGALVLSPEAVKCLCFSIAHVVAGAIPSPVFVIRAIQTWYDKIDLPPWTPPNKVFGPVWTLLYASIGWAFGIILHKVTTSASPMAWYASFPVRLWALHMALNLSWAPTFFGFKRLRLACWISSSMLATTLLTIPAFYKVSPLAAYLLLPYMVWQVYATALNAEICRRNPTVNGTNEAMRQAALFKKNKS